MGHKYRKKNQLRKQSRLERRTKRWSLPALISQDVERSMRDYFIRALPWSSPKAEPFWKVEPNPTKAISYEELMEWGKDPDDTRSIGELVGMEPKETYLVGERGPEVLLKSPPRRS